MKLVEVDCNSIVLEGITLNASFTISNPHQILAVMFELEAKPSYFQIEPQRGMVLQGEKKFIKIRLQPQLRISAERIQKEENILAIRATYYCEYNRKLLEKNNLKGWSKISKQYWEDSLPIRLSFEAEVEKLKRTIKRGNSYKQSPKQNSFEKFRDSSIKRVKDPKLNEDLDFLFRNEDYARQERSKRHKENRKTSHEYSPVPRMIQSKEIKVTNPNGSQMQKEKKVSLISNPAIHSTRGRNMQIVILAVIAALCLVAGQTFGAIFKR